MATLKPYPQPDYDYNAKQLVEIYRNARKEIQRQLDDFLLSEDFTSAAVAQARLQAVERILSELGRVASERATQAVTSSYLSGIESAQHAIGVTINAVLTTPHKRMVAALVADTQNDILATNAYIDKQVKRAVREAMSEGIRATLGSGDNNAKQIKADVLRRLRKRLRDAANTALTDSKGRRWDVDRYVDMLVFTKQKDAHMEASRVEAVERGVEYGVIIGPPAKDACRYHVGRVVRMTEAGDKQYMTLDELRGSGQIFHPKCRHSVVPYADPSQLSPTRQQTAEAQEKAGRQALATGKRNPTL
ncbi:phage minor capsid protein [Exiguobacterium sp. CinTr1]|uniref:phage minor capsid protein n=1 Tax=Exiguobacterium sp. CinTr1 TaxID=2995315 RepID=UPI0022E69942|nr:phage minor capsid protein [Exiguobacterium sp. CinTr1]